MHRALGEYQVLGVKTTVPFHRWLLKHPPFVAGDLDTELLERDWHPDGSLDPETAERAAVLAALSEHLGQSRHQSAASGSTEETGRWLSFARRAGLRVP
jgi:acetyl/propionyl-CoA carboxylase alpha subunit